MKSKPFDPTKPVQTRDGRKVKIVATNVKHPFSILAIVENREGLEQGFHYHSDGKAAGHSDPWDLVNVPERVVRFVNVYSKRFSIGSPHDSLQKAIGSRIPSQRDHGGVYRVTFEDGKVVEFVPV